MAEPPSQLSRLDFSAVSSVLCVAAHPDDMEYGASAAVAQWSCAGIDVHYLLLTAGEAGIRSMEPNECARIRRGEQERACAEAGAASLRIADFPDGLLEHSPAVRREICRSIRSVRPQLVVTGAYELEVPWGFNHVDHRACGMATIDAMRDADNPWIFTDCGPAWKSSMLVLTGSPRPTHWVELTEDSVEAGIRSLEAHEAYLAELGANHPRPRDLITSVTTDNGVPARFSLPVRAVQM